MSDFVICSTCFIIWSEGSISGRCDNVGRYNLADIFIGHLYSQIMNSVLLQRFCIM